LEVSNIDLGRRARSLRLDTLVRLRWLAVAGQITAVLLTHFLLRFQLPLGPALAAISISAWLNLGLKVRYPVTQRLDDRAAFVLLAYDVLQLSCLLFLTGGLENPFSVLFLAPVMISAVSLSGPWTLRLTFVMIAAATTLVFFHLPLPWYADRRLSLPIAYVGGIWLALVLGAGFIGVYAIRVAEEARQLADALAATELVLAREQHLTQLDGLAAAAAHELGTPLATITLVVNEMLKATPDWGHLQDDVALLAQETQRCRQILAKIASLGDDATTMLDEMTLGHLLEEVVQPERDFGVAVEVSAIGEDLEPVCRRNPGILYGLGNLVENAIDFARSMVRIKAEWSCDVVRIGIADDGPGFSPDVLARVGEPYVTSRDLQRRFKSEEGSGLGLGLFIAKTLLERSGATVSTANALVPEVGARVVVSWPRALFERGRAPATRQAEIEPRPTYNEDARIHP
jgi:two-component system, sensor histidine kinase RegB